MLINPIRLPIERLVPDEELFAQASDIHGQRHVARVVILGFVLVDRLNLPDDAPRLWAAIYLHDLGRTHDGRCYEHGRLAMERLEQMPELRELFAAGGVSDEDYEAIGVAVRSHCLPEELAPEHPHWRLTALLKDADGLDRVRLGDLKPEYLRFDVSREMVRFAQALYDATRRTVEPGPGYMGRLWPVAQELAGLQGVLGV